MQKSLISLALPLALAGAAFATDETIPAPPPDWLGPADLEPEDTALPPSFSLGSYTVTFETTTLGEVAETAGGHIARIEGSDGRGAYALCYTLPEARLWIMADAEMGGTDRAVTDAVMTAGAFSAEPGCPALGEEYLAAVFITGVAIGASPQAVSDALGEPSYEEDGKTAYLSEEPSDAGNECTVTRMTGAATEDGRITELRLRQLTSC